MGLRAVACATCIAAALVVPPSWAQSEAPSVADLLIAAIDATGEMQATYESASASADVVTITALEVTLREDRGTATIPTLVISGAAERDDGGFTAARMTFDNGSVRIGDNTATWATAAAGDVIIPSVDEVKERARIRPFGRLAFGSLEMARGPDADELAIADLSIEVGEMVDETAKDVRIRANGAQIPASYFTGSIVSAVINRLGYETFTADIAIDGDYDTAGDHLTMRGMSIDAEDIGKVDMVGQFSGLSLLGMVDAKKAEDARANAKLDSMTLRLENEGVVERILDMQAEMLGGTREDVRAQFVYGALPFALSFVENERFRDQFLLAASTFLEEPESLTFRVEPSEPVPLQDIYRAARSSPLALPDLLTPHVEANSEQTGR